MGYDIYIADNSLPEEEGYFRFNIFGMGWAFSKMNAFGMLTPEVADKLSWNDGLRVNPREIKAALKIYDAIPREQVVAVVDVPDDPWYLKKWDDWIAFWRRAQDHRGFHVW